MYTIIWHFSFSKLNVSLTLALKTSAVGPEEIEFKKKEKQKQEKKRHMIYPELSKVHFSCTPEEISEEAATIKNLVRWFRPSGYRDTATFMGATDIVCQHTHTHTHRLSLTHPYSLHLYHFFLGISQQTAGGHLCDCFVGESSTVGSGPKLPALTGLSHTSSISPHSVLPRGVALISCCTIHLTCFLRTAAALFHSSQNL